MLINVRVEVDPEFKLMGSIFKVLYIEPIVCFGTRPIYCNFSETLTEIYAPQQSIGFR